MHARPDLRSGADPGILLLKSGPSTSQTAKEEIQVKGQLMSNRIAASTRSDTLASHILPTSATMIGVCATLIGLIKLAEEKLGSSHVDEYAALVAVTFLASALASYLSIRCSNRPRLSVRTEQIVDLIFLGGLIGITLVATLFAYEVI